MSLVVLESLLDKEQKALLEKTKSISSISGLELRKAHKQLGECAAAHIVQSADPDSENYAVVILMRAGLSFGLGIADGLEQVGKQVSIHFAEKNGLKKSEVESIVLKCIVIVDAVVNTGKSVIELINQFEHIVAREPMVATLVMPEEARQLADSLNIHTMRVSKHKYKGAKVSSVDGGYGPDTGDRLFGT